jgi:arsenate reductase
MIRVLFLCTGNSCRSIMAEALLAHYGGDGFLASSAGSFPTDKVHPLSLETLKARGIATQGFRSKSWDEFSGQRIDIVITVCDAAAGEACPLFPGTPIKAHWGVEDPAKFIGTPEKTRAEFTRACDVLEWRVRAMTRLPFETMDKEERQQKLREIGGL